MQQSDRDGNTETGIHRIERDITTKVSHSRGARRTAPARSKASSSCRPHLTKWVYDLQHSMIMTSQHCCHQCHHEASPGPLGTASCFYFTSVMLHMLKLRAHLSPVAHTEN